LLSAVIEHRLDNSDGSMEYLSKAAQELEKAQSLMNTMRTNAWDPNGERLFTEGANSTIYQFGYLYRASDLCYWQREQIQATNAIMSVNEAPPGCGL